MRAATSRPEHARAIAKLINAWNMGVSYGIPVGPSPIRLIAELAISDIDAGLLAENLDVLQVFRRLSILRLKREDLREKLLHSSQMRYSKATG